MLAVVHQCGAAHHASPSWSEVVRLHRAAQPVDPVRRKEVDPARTATLSAHPAQQIPPVSGTPDSGDRRTPTRLAGTDIRRRQGNHRRSRASEGARRTRPVGHEPLCSTTVVPAPDAPYIGISSASPGGIGLPQRSQFTGEPPAKPCRAWRPKGRRVRCGRWRRSSSASEACGMRCRFCHAWCFDQQVLRVRGWSSSLLYLCPDR